MINWESALVPQESTILETIKIIDSTNLRIGVGIVIDNDGKIIGVVTDGDIRRGLLQAVALDASIESIMTTSPITAYEGEDNSNIIKKLERYRINHIPIVDKDHVVVGLKTSDICFVSSEKNVPVIIMVGGRGERLRPITDECPKPMLKLGQKPLLDLIIRNLISFGFNSFWLATNYKKNIIKDYFKDGSDLGVNIKYIEEEKKLGTAGALALYSEQVPVEDAPVLIMNGDVLTDINYDLLLQEYENNGRGVIMCIKEYSYELPYGTVELERDRVINIVEKPKYTLYVNSGIYMFNSKLLRYIPKNRFYNMTTFIEDLLRQEYFVSVFLIREYWLDIGSRENYREAIKRVDYV